MSRGFDPQPPPPSRTVVEFNYPELTPRYRRFWLIVDPSAVDLCATNPGYDVDLYVRSDLRSMTAIWMGVADARREIEAGRVELTGSPATERLFVAWLGRSPMAMARREVLCRSADMRPEMA